MAEKVTIGNAELWHGDCREILASMADDSVNWCVTSPPYNLHKEHHTSPGAATQANAAMSAKYAEWYDDDMGKAEYQAEQKRVVADLLRVCTDSVFYNHRIRYAWHARNKSAPACKVYHPLHWLSDSDLVRNHLGPLRRLNSDRTIPARTRIDLPA